MKYYLLIATISFALIIASYKNNQVEAESNKTAVDSTAISNGFNLLATNCFTCHSPNAAIDSRVAPPMEAIKRHYINQNTSETEFTNSLIAYLNNPSEQTSKMPGAIQKFGVMPKMSFNETQLKEIAYYIYHTELEKPEWFEQHYAQEQKRYGNQASYNSPLAAGQSFALQTKAILGKNLLNAINTKGVDEALSFCSTKAITLTDSMATVLNVKIKRVSDKNRNPINNANAEELAYIRSMKEKLLKGETISPQLSTTTTSNIGYYPIMVDQMCLQCHGTTNAEITPANSNKIQSIYPNDKATGYQLNELRGIWVVEMNK